MSGDAKDKKSHLIIVFGFLVVLIVCSVVVIAVVASKNNDNSVMVEDKDQSLMNVLNFEAEVREKLSSDSHYTTDDAIKEYESELKKGDNSHKFEVAVSYAYFLSERLGLHERAISIIKAYENKISTNDEFLTYYLALRDFTGAISDDSNQDFYNAKIDEYAKKVNDENQEGN